MGVLAVVVGWLALEAAKGPCPGCGEPNEARLRGSVAAAAPLARTSTNEF